MKPDLTYCLAFYANFDINISFVNSKLMTHLTGLHPLVTAIVPCYNVSAYVERSVGSLLNQKYKNLEIICVDNASTDDTMAVLQKIKERYPEIIVLSEVTPGACAARNCGLKAAKGQWVQFLDADDTIEPDKIMHQVNLISGLKEIGLIAGMRTWVFTDGTERIEEFSGDKWQDLIDGKLGHTCANLWKKNELDDLNGWNESMKSSQEYELMFRMLKKEIAVLYDRAVLTTVYERKSGSISKQNPAANIHRSVMLRLDMYNYLLKEGKDQYRDAINLFLFNALSRLYKADDILFNETCKLIKERHPLNMHNNPGLPVWKRTLILVVGIKRFIKLLHWIRK